jgi:hypothetical protein
MVSFVLALCVTGAISEQRDHALAEAAIAPPVASSPPPRLIFWLGCERDVVSLTNAQLDMWRSRGVDGFVCMGQRLMSGPKQAFSGNPNADLSAAGYQLQRALRDSKIVERAASRGMKMYLGVKLHNNQNRATPLMQWFDDVGWSQEVLPRMRDLAGAAKLLGFAGIAFDQEMYETPNNRPSWNWNYPGNTRTEALVRAKARQRGAEVMNAIVGAFPGAEFAVYGAFFPGDWNEFLQLAVNGAKDVSTMRVDVDFWDGMTSVEGYGPIRFFDAVFYKAPQKGTWDNALTYEQNQVYATFSRRFSNWDYAWSRVDVSPFAWIDAGPTTSTFDDARSPGYVAAQLLAFRRWAVGGEFANYAYAPMASFDYSPYVSAMQNASAPAVVDSEAPTLKVTGITAASGAPAIEGTAHDNFAIRAVRWKDDRGGSGVASLEWQVLSGNYSSGYVWQTRWSIPVSSLTRAATKVTVVAEDIHERAATAAIVPVP